MLKAYAAYACYLFQHKLEVFKWCWHFGIPWRGLCHDLSKFRWWSEFKPHALYFFGPPEKRDQNALDAAWLRHIHRNPHHWNFYLVVDEEGYVNCLDIPDKYRKEMLADFLAKGQSRGANAWDWYECHNRTLGLHPNVHRWLKTQLDFYARQNGATTH